MIWDLSQIQQMHQLKQDVLKMLCGKTLDFENMNQIKLRILKALHFRSTCYDCRGQIQYLVVYFYYKKLIGLRCFLNPHYSSDYVCIQLNLVPAMGSSKNNENLFSKYLIGYIRDLPAESSSFIGCRKLFLNEHVEQSQDGWTGHGALSLQMTSWHPLEPSFGSGRVQE